MRIGTRASSLAVVQAEHVAELLGADDVVPISTSGDRGAPASDKSRWVAELEQALIKGRIDIAVHSAKDVPGELAPGLELLGSPQRAPAEDALCGVESLAQLPPGARVGTSSIRRAAQLRALREDLELLPLRGNVDTRLAKLRDASDGVRALVLARAGLQRLRREDAIGEVLDPRRFVPAPGQGALALEGRADDDSVRRAAHACSDRATFACLLAERSLAQSLQASCHTPLGAHAAPAGAGRLLLRSWVGLPDGSEWIADELTGELADPRSLGEHGAERLRAVGAAELLRRAQEMADVAVT
ncbi:MAG TPA: hydroxymethylbilane synthase [Solirubrobacteraceae bacterium]|nr:hydroxymethylbilane synthase [Solirubrobacteraceae bacterium]